MKRFHGIFLCLCVVLTLIHYATQLVLSSRLSATAAAAARAGKPPLPPLEERLDFKVLQVVSIPVQPALQLLPINIQKNIPRPVRLFLFLLNSLLWGYLLTFFVLAPVFQRNKDSETKPNGSS